jgi:multicomponent Na+:H+ antiporter subunit E
VNFIFDDKFGNRTISGAGIDQMGPQLSGRGQRYIGNHSDRPAGRPSQFKRRIFFPYLATFVVSLATWVVLSGKFDAFHLSLGVVSCLIVTVMSGRLLIASTTVAGFASKWVGFIRYLPYLLFEILKANIHVLRLVFHPRMAELINPRIITFKSGMTDEMGLFILANSITLTPGTITVYVSTYGNYSVHAIDDVCARSLPGEMERRVANIFGE